MRWVGSVDILAWIAERGFWAFRQEILASEEASYSNSRYCTGDVNRARWLLVILKGVAVFLVLRCGSVCLWLWVEEKFS
jgi:hypothetical protein